MREKKQESKCCLPKRIVFHVIRPLS